ncbi:ephrin type-B receptor 4b [Eucyclogobius newberryi]|uniref:ephrin type-B receptor 4b n=1 Tax=Eucyclogobius newberryi TaxID=166745 RepID=UPI003B58FC44
MGLPPGRACCSCGVWMLLLRLLLPRCAAEEEVLLNTKLSTSDLRWSVYPGDDPQWDELSVLDDEHNTVRTFEICSSNSPTVHWLRTNWIPRKSGTTVYAEIRFTMMECSSLNQRHCKETFTLFSFESDQATPPRSSPDSAPDSAPPEPFVKVATVAADFLLRRGGGNRRSNTRLLRLDGLTRAGLYLAIQSQGTCMALLSLKVFYRKCPPLRLAFASFPETVPHALVQQAQGVCVENALTPPGEQTTLPSMLCGEDGQWVGQPSSSCACRPGYEAAGEARCRACPAGHFKPASGPGTCTSCPDFSGTLVPGSAYCLCRHGYLRADSDSPSAACSTPPSAPRSPVAQVNASGSVVLEWGAPLDTGGRSDLWYHILCQRCPDAALPLVAGCSPCDDGILIGPSNTVSQRRVVVIGLRPRALYIFTVQSLNGVSALSQSQPSAVKVNVTTNTNVPGLVSGLKRTSASENSLTLEWTPPNQVLNPDQTRSQTPNRVLDYQLRYCPKEGEGSGQWQYVSSRAASLVLLGLRRSTKYMVQVRARSSTGFGPFSADTNFSTLPEGNSHLVLTAVLVTMTILLLVGGSMIAALCYRKKTRRGLRDKSSFQMNQSMKLYIDPFTYEDPEQAVRQFTREIDASCVKIEEVIGAGEFGEVCRGRLQVPGRRENYVAIKTLKGGYTDKQRRDFLSEASIMGQFQHPNIIHLEGVITSSCPAMILTEYMENGALDSFLRMNDGQFTVIQLVGMLRGIAAGMKYLSEMSYVHRDLAARNILVNSNLVCKVSDFGLSRFLTENSSDPTYTSSLGGKIPIRWTAPEAIAYRKFTSASDAWSYGIVMWEVMSYGERPYWDMSNQDVINAIEQDYRLPPPPDCPAALHWLMLDCWQKERANRPRFCDVVSALDRLIRNPASLKITDSAHSSQPLLDQRPITRLSSCSSVSDWLRAIKMERYEQSFLQNGLTSLQEVSLITTQDLLRAGVTLAGHQKKILTSIQTLRCSDQPQTPTLLY